MDNMFFCWFFFRRSIYLLSRWRCSLYQSIWTLILLTWTVMYYFLKLRRMSIIFKRFRIFIFIFCLFIFILKRIILFIILFFLKLLYDFFSLFRQFPLIINFIRLCFRLVFFIFSLSSIHFYSINIYLLITSLSSAWLSILKCYAFPSSLFKVYCAILEMWGIDSLQDFLFFLLQLFLLFIK